MMFKLLLVSVVAFVATLVNVEAMKGGQILDQPLPFTVYILTGDRDDVFYMREQKKKVVLEQGATSEGISLAFEEYRSTSPAEQPDESVENNSTNGKADASPDKVKMNGDVKKDKLVSPDASLGTAGRQSGDESVPVAPLDDAELSLLNNSGKGNEAVKSVLAKETDESIDGYNQHGPNKGDPVVLLKNGITNESDTDALKREVASNGGSASGQPILGISKDEIVASGEGKVSNVEVVSEKSAINSVNPSSTGGTVSDTGISTHLTTAGDYKSTPDNDEKVTGASKQRSPKAASLQYSQAAYGRTNESKPSPPHCKLAASATASPTSVKPPRPQTLWRLCMGVVFDKRIILTGSICFARDKGLHFFISVNATNHSEAQEITRVSEGRNLFDFRVIRLNENQTMPGLVADWQDEETVIWDLEELSNASKTGIVPSFGYPPKVAALKLLPLHKCRKIYDELQEAYPAETSTLPAFLVETVACATQADRPIGFPDGWGLVQPGLACPDSLGAPFVLSDGTVLGVLVAADCRLKNVAFFQTLGRGIPEDEEDEEMA